MITTLIVPGLDGSPAPHWQDHWAATDPRALMVELSNPERPIPAVWEIELASTILRHPDCVLVGHSLGSVLVARILTKWPQLKVRGALLVAPAETEGTRRIDQFGALPEQALGVPTTVVASRNDPWMRFARSAALARAWQADLIDMGFAGHINVASGFGPWPEARRLRDDLLAAGPVPYAPTMALRAGLATTRLSPL